MGRLPLSRWAPLTGQSDFQPSQDPGHSLYSTEEYGEFPKLIIAKPVAGGDRRNIKQICNEFLLLKLL